ncbi:MAG: COX15/CtaA family protein [Pseudomonadota bacterium]
MRISRLALLLTLTVILLGAWTRLRDAGLGCPDWPTCYGHLTVPSSPESLARANALFPGQIVVPEKAWPETIHRYFASGIGLVILILASMMLWRRKDIDMPWRHGLLLLALVCLQGAFGALTVTEKLYPPVVTSHLLLGFSTLSGLFLLHLRLRRAFPRTGDWRMAKFTRLAFFALAVVVLQITLGGWTASNYAATVCTDLPICQPGWSQLLQWREAFSLTHVDDVSYEFAPHLSAAAKVTIHVAHRIGAMVVVATLLLLAFQLLRHAQAIRYRLFAVTIAMALFLQVLLGVANVHFQLPLWNAVAHNVWAAVLLQILVALIYALKKEKH